MYCDKCGAQLNDNSRVCPQCGAPIQGEEQNITTTSTYAGPLGDPKPVLVWGILGLAFACTFFLSFLGIIFSCIGLKKANAYYQFTNYAQSGQAKTGRALSKAGLIVGIILTVLCVIYVIAIVGLVSNYSTSYYRYY